MRLRRRGLAALAAAGLAALASCAPAPAPPAVPQPAAGAGAPLRVAVVGRAAAVRIGGTGAWRLERLAGGAPLADESRAGEWRIEPVFGTPGRLTIRAPAGAEAVAAGPLVARPAHEGGFVTVEGRAYRGTAVIVATDTGLLVINRVPLEEYLRGVVAVEMGPRTAREREALAAQAIASRGFAVVRRRAAPGDAAYDLVATVLAQAYGGATAENALATEAVERTRGLVLQYEGRPIEAVYSSTCGGSTAAASEVWRSADVPWLRPVSDAIPRTERFYCSDSPRFRWTREIGAEALTAAVRRYLPAVAGVPSSAVGDVRDVHVGGTTASGRISALSVRTDKGGWTLRGNDVRFVLRDSNGGILPSTYFSLATRRDASGALRAVTLDGRGNGHGIGMCQWGAIGRARAGQDFRRILETYYPGTTLARAD